MPQLRDFPARIPETAISQLTDLQKRCVEMFCEDRMTQEAIGLTFDPPVQAPAVSKTLDRALATIKGCIRRGYAASLSTKHVPVAIA